MGEAVPVWLDSPDRDVNLKPEVILLIELAAGAQNCDVCCFVLFWKVYRFFKKFKTLYIILESESTNTVCLGAVSNGLFFSCPGSECIRSTHQALGEVQKGANRSNKSKFFVYPAL